MSLKGCLVKKSVAQTGANYSLSPAIAWDAEVYDTDGFHDNVTNNTRITIPSAVNGLYGIFTCCASLALVTADSSCALSFIKNSAVSFGWGGANRSSGTGNGQASTSIWMQLNSQPVLLTTGDFYTNGLFCNDTSITVNTESSFSLLVLNSFSNRQRVLAAMNANQTAVDYSTPTAIAFDGPDFYDSDNIHDPSSNNTKLIIPSALNGAYVVVEAQAKASNVTGALSHAMAIRKNSSVTYDGLGANSGKNTNAGGEGWIQTQTPAIQVATNDAFEALYYNADTSITLESAFTFLGLRVVS